MRKKLKRAWPWRRACLVDVPPLARLINGAYRGDSGRKGWTTEADLLGGQRVDEEMLRELISEGKRHLLIATDKIDELEDQPSALIGCVAVEKESSRSAGLGLLTVAVEAQQRGLGDFLVGVAEEYARAQFNSDEMGMHVISVRRELTDWYERRGYVKTGERAPFPYDNPRFGVPLVSDLQFLVLAKALLKSTSP
jgi:ribosomal protein S18 acetylase RimI-like enzyme